MPDADADAFLDELYRCAPEEFVATRDRMVRELREQGDRDAARIVAAQHRPTIAADVVNRVARSHADELREFLALAPRLHDAQVAAIADAAARDDVRALQRERRERTEQLASMAPTHRDDIARALDAALVDDEVALLLTRGRLSRVPDAPAGFGTLEAAIESLPPRAASSSKTPERRDDAKLARAREAEEQARADVTAANAEVRRLRDALHAAERHAQEAARRAERAASARHALERDR